MEQTLLGSSRIAVTEVFQEEIRQNLGRTVWAHWSLIQNKAAHTWWDEIIEMSCWKRIQKINFFGSAMDLLATRLQ